MDKVGVDWDVVAAFRNELFDILYSLSLLHHLPMVAVVLDILLLE